MGNPTGYPPKTRTVVERKWEIFSQSLLSAEFRKSVTVRDRRPVDTLCPQL